MYCLGITEPDAGSDVAGIRTRAVRDGDEWVINGSKTYITNGIRAGMCMLVTKTDPDAGHHGFTVFLVPMDTPGVIREQKLSKMGMHASDTALLALADTCVQIHGGAGYMTEYGVERDLRLYRIGAGTDEILLDVIGKSYGF